MKKALLTIACLFLMAGVANAQTWYTANQKTIAWDPVAKIAATDVIKYQVYTKVGSSGTPSKVGGEITETQMTVTFNVEGRYFLGVDAVRYPAGETVGIHGERISWSDIAADCAAAGPFGIVYYVSPAAVKGLRDVP